MKTIGRTDNGIPYSQAEAEAYDDSLDEDSIEPTVRHPITPLVVFLSVLALLLVGFGGCLSHAIWGAR